MFVTQNKHKLAELSPLFKKFGVSFETSSLEKFEVRSDDVETVALHAAENAYRELQHPAVVDDTGLFIDSLSGFPMVYPGFVLNTIGKEGILRLLEGVKDRGAKFVTAVGFSNGADNLTFVGEMTGTISESIIGSEGFGYDPIFIPEGETRTFAQLSFEEKVAISHRTKAFRKFLEWYVKNH